MSSSQTQTNLKGSDWDVTKRGHGHWHDEKRDVEDELRQSADGDSDVCDIF